MLCGCAIASEPVEIDMQKEVVFEDGSNNIDNILEWKRSKSKSKIHNHK